MIVTLTSTRVLPLEQTRIDAHFLTYHSDTRFAKITSDRLREAVVQITGKRSAISLSGGAPKQKERIIKRKEK